MQKNIVLKKITLHNYKGITDQTFEFTPKENTIAGANATGKSSLFSAFVWVLFGKDQFGRKDHQIKNLVGGKSDRNKKSEVEILLDIDGQTTTLKKIYQEKWVRPTGAVEDTFKGHTTTYYIDEVPVKESEYNTHISTICPENVFKAITNPHYFPDLKADEQRAILVKLIGEISNEQIAEGNQPLQEFLSLVTGKTFESFKKEISEKKRKITKELQDIPARIDELRRTIPEALNWVAIQNGIKLKEEELTNLRNQANDNSLFSQSQHNDRMQIRSRINQLQTDNLQIDFNQRSERTRQINELNREIQNLQNQKANLQNDHRNKLLRLEYLQKEDAKLNKQLQELGQTWKAINAEKLTFNDHQFMCPTCNRPLEPEQIEEKQQQMISNFNAAKAERLAKNVQTGKECKKQLDAIIGELQTIPGTSEADTTNLQTQIQEKERQIEQIRNTPLNLENIPQYKENLQQINELKQQLEQEPETSAASQLQPLIQDIELQIKNLRSDLAKKEIIDTAEKRISELEAQKKQLQQELADLEQKEFLQKSFEYAKNQHYENQVNKHFRLVKFKMFKEQVDGQILPTCEATYDGVPYSTLNNAMQINIGLDIIDTISRHEGIYAPIWLDNRESVTTIPEVSAQIINLTVDPDEPKLRMLNNI